MNKANSLGSGARQRWLRHVPAMTLDMSVNFLILMFSPEKYTCFMGFIWGFNHSAWHLISANLVLAIRASIKEYFSPNVIHLSVWESLMIPNKLRNQILSGDRISGSSLKCNMKYQQIKFNITRYINLCPSRHHSTFMIVLMMVLAVNISRKFTTGK